MSHQKIGRNELCPCNSGKKYKFCCGSNSAPSHALITYGNPTTRQLPIHVPASNQMLMNRVRRESATIAENFDALTRDHVPRIDRFYSNAAALVFMGKQFSEMEEDDLRTCLAILLSNVLKSFTGAFSLLRTGWRLQPFMCLRNAYEGLGVAIHLGQHPEDLARYKGNQLDSTKTISSAKSLLPFFGKLWGDFSRQFMHIGEPFRHVQLGNLYTREESDLWHCLSHLAFFSWLSYQTAELVFYDYATVRHFWTRIGDREYKLTPSGEMKEEERQLVEQYKILIPNHPTLSERKSRRPRINQSDR